MFSETAKPLAGLPLAAEDFRPTGALVDPDVPNHTARLSTRSQGQRGVSTDKQRWLVDCLLLICLLATVAAKSIIPAVSMDEDLWWHISTGNWILSRNAVPVRDVFSAYTMGTPWIAYSWLFDILSSVIYRRQGLHGILILTTLLTLSFVALSVLLLSQYCRMLRALALAGLVFVASSSMVTPRPWLFTFVFFVLQIYLLMQARATGNNRWLLPLPPLFALWANLHIQFVYGLGILGLFAMERQVTTLLKWPPVCSRLRTRSLWIALMTSMVATLLNPYGWRIYTVVLQYATQSVPLKVVNEMQAMSFRSVPDWTALFLACSALFSLASSCRRSGLMMSLLAVSLWFGFHTGRDVWFLAVVSALVIASSGAPAESDLRNYRRVQWAIALPVSLALAFAVLASPAVSPKALEQAAAKRFPVKASAFIEDHALQGPLYNPYDWGGYLIWRLPRLPVSIDGRANLHGDVRLSRAVATWTGGESWTNDPELMKAGTIILQRGCALASILRTDPKYRMVYQDEVAAVFQPARLPR